MAENSEDRCLLRAFESYENVVSWANGEACNFTAPVVIVGHVSFDIVRASAIMKTPRVFSVTFLRDPLARVLSFANFKNVALEEFLGGAWTRIATNVATLMLNGVNDAAPQTQYSLLQSPVEGMCQNDPVEAIASARHQLVDVITVFGITEHFVEAMWLLMKTFGWDIETVKGPLLHPKKAFCAGSVDPEDCGKNYFTVEDIDPDTQAAIRKAEVCDYAVYETALDVFHARIAAGDQEDLADFQSAIRAAELEVSR